MSHNFGITEYQKSVAKELLYKISLVDPSAILAGGAVRDWYLGNPAKDLDIYIRCPNHIKLSDKIDMLKKIGLSNAKQLSKNSEENYASVSGLLSVFEGCYSGVKVNIMFMDLTEIDGISLVENFDCSICECFMDKDNKYYYSSNFIKTIESKVIFVDQRHAGNEPHIVKMANRFPEYIFAKIIRNNK